MTKEVNSGVEVDSELGEQVSSNSFHVANFWAPPLTHQGAMIV